MIQSPSDLWSVAGRCFKEGIVNSIANQPKSVGVTKSGCHSGRLPLVILSDCPLSS